MSCRGHGRVRRGDEVHVQRTWSREEREKLPSGHRGGLDVSQCAQRGGQERRQRGTGLERRAGRSYRSVGIRFSPARECGEGERDKERQRQRHTHRAREERRRRRRKGGWKREKGRERERRKKGRTGIADTMLQGCGAAARLPGHWLLR